MYIDTIEAVMSNSTKIMIDVEGGNNLLYLPLDKIMERSQSEKDNYSGANTSGANYGNASESRNRRGRR